MVATAFVLLLFVIATSVPIAIGMVLLAFAMDALYAVLPLHRAIGEILWTQSHNSLLASVPLFVMMGQVMLRSGLADKMFAAASYWLSWLPGGIMHANVWTGALLATTSGSSVATTATLATTALPIQAKHNYNHPIFLGSIAAGGSLGIMIPPSTNMIFYGFLTNTSIPDLFLAGILPGLVLTLLYSAMIVAYTFVQPNARGEVVRATTAQRIGSLKELLPPLLLFVAVLGSLYAGIATPTEAAGVGVCGALLIAKVFGRLDLRTLHQSGIATVRTSAMMVFITVCALFLNFVLGALGFTRQIQAAFAALEIGPYYVFALIVLMYILLGMFMDSLAMIVLTVPFVLPIIVGLGFDPVWFGIIIVIVTELAMLTPPIGMGCFVIQGLRSSGTLSEVFRGVMPFIAVLVFLIVLLAIFPALALWLPSLAKV